MSIETNHEKSKEAHLKLSFYIQLEICDNYYKTDPD